MEAYGNDSSILPEGYGEGRSSSSCAHHRDLSTDFVPRDMSPDSACLRTSSGRRSCHLTSILPITKVVDGVRTVQDFRVYLEAAAFLAFRHLQERSGSVIPELPLRLKDCDIDFSYTLRDSRFSAIEAARQLLSVLDTEGDGMQPFALLGAARSAVSEALAVLSGTYQVPQVSSSSTSSSLDNKSAYPFFARTVPNNSGDAKAVAVYLQSLNVSHFAILYIQDGFGTAYAFRLLEEARQRGMTVIFVGFTEENMERAIIELVNSNMKYFMGIFNPSTWKQVVRIAARYNIMGVPGYTWLLSEASLELTTPGFSLDAVEEVDLAWAIHGAGVVLLNVDSHDAFDRALADFSSNSTLQNEFVEHHAEAEIFQDFEFAVPGSSLYYYLTYDAVLALGITACEAPGLFTGPEFYDRLLQTEFKGVSGVVSFDPSTGTRRGDDFSFRIENIRVSEERSDSQRFRFSSDTSVVVQFPSNISTLKPYYYTDNSTTPPLSIPPLEVDMNLIPTSIQAVGMSLGAAVMVTSVAWMVWTYHNRNKDVVRASQPFFLGQLCMGAFIMGSAVIPLGLQEPISQNGLDLACMAPPWLISVGFVVAFSALFSKTWRLNQLFRGGMGFRRIQVRVVDVMLPFLMLMGINFALLLTWTLVAPLRWSRQEVDNFDQFGRNVESFGSCYSMERYEGGISPFAFLVPLIAVDCMALIFACYQSFLARGLPVDFSESFYVALTIASSLETIVIGGPIVILVRKNPPALFLVSSLLISILCFAILLPIFVPKYVQRDINKRAPSTLTGVGLRSSVRSSLQDMNERRSQHVSLNRDVDKNSKAGLGAVKRNASYYYQRTAPNQMKISRNGQTILRGDTTCRLTAPAGDHNLQFSPPVLKAAVLDPTNLEQIKTRCRDIEAWFEDHKISRISSIE